VTLSLAVFEPAIYE